MTEVEILKSEIEELTESLALATGIGDGFFVRSDAGEILAVIASAPFEKSTDAVVFASWLRDTLSDPQSLAEMLGKVAWPSMRAVN